MKYLHEASIVGEIRNGWVNLWFIWYSLSIVNICNYTARNVIVPDPTLRDNEVDLSYHTFRELFKPKIINYLKVYEDIPLSKAEDIWEDSFIFNQKVYDIMMMIVKKEEVTLLINRNPTLTIIWCRKTYLMAGNFR